MTAPSRTGTYKVVVVHPSGAITSQECSSLDDAKSCADEAAVEQDSGPVVATVYDEEGRVVHRGAPWWMGSRE